jgi:hypothetical protein
VKIGNFSFKTETASPVQGSSSGVNIKAYQNNVIGFCAKQAPIPNALIIPISKNTRLSITDIANNVLSYSERIQISTTFFRMSMSTYGQQVHCKKKVSDFPVPRLDVTNQTLHGWE